MAPITFDTFHNIIDGKPSPTAKTIHNINPATEEPNPEHSLSTQEDVDRAVAVARAAFEKWRLVPREERSKAVGAFAQALMEQIPDFVPWVTKEMGMPLAIAKIDVGMAGQRMLETLKLPFEEEVVEEREDKTVINQYAPMGVALGILAWNFPTSLCCQKIAPAVLSGNSVIIKPSPFAPYTALKACELAQQFFPPGVVQCLVGDDSLGAMLTAHAGIDKVSFTGSVATGKKVMAACAGTLKRVTLELGGNDPAIVFPDTDLSKTIPLLAQMSMINTGQICNAIKRIYVHESIYPQVLQGYVSALPMFKVADGMAEGTMMGPQANEMQFKKVQNLLADIKSTNLTVAGEGTAPSGKGYFVAPKVIDNPPEDSRLVLEEQFAPIVPFMKWSDEEDVIRRANKTSYGLGASVWTQDKEKAKQVARRLEAGTVWVNQHLMVDPSLGFGGHKQSGIGHELGPEGLKSFCNHKLIYIPRVDPGPLEL